MAEMTEGNLNTLIMMRVKNEETANLLVKILPQVGVVGHTQVSMVKRASISTPPMKIEYKLPISQ